MASSTEIRSGRAYVELGLRDNALSQGLRAAEAKLKAWGKAISGVGKSLMGLGGGAVAGLAGLANNFADAAVGADNFAAKTGTALDTSQALVGAFGMMGGSGEGVSTMFEHMSKVVYEASQGSAEAQETLSQLGTSAQQLAQMAPDQQMEKLADGLSRVQNSGFQAALAEEAFGKSVGDSLPLLKQGAAGIEKMKAAYKEHHQIYSAEDVEAARRFQLAASDLTGDLQKVGLAIGKAVLPLLEQFVTWLVPIVDQIVQWVNNNTDLIQTVFEVAAGVAAAGAALYALGTAFSVVGDAAGIAGAIVMAATTPWIAIPALVVGAVAYLAYMGGAFDDLSETATDAWGGIVDAIKAGDLGLAFKISVQGLYIVWLDFRNWALMQWDNLTVAWKVILNGFLGAWDWLITQLRIGWVRFEEFLHIMNQESADAAVKSLQDEEAQRGDVRDQDTAAALDAANAVEADRQKEVDDAKASLKDMAQTASTEAKKARQPKALPPPSPSATGGKPFLPGGPGESIGTFSAAAAGGLGFGESNGAMIRTATEQTAQNTAIIAAGIAAIGAVG